MTSPEGQPLVDVQSVTVRRSQRQDPVLQDVSFTVQPGEHVVLVGGNGSGKTTLTRLLNGTLLPDSGQVVVAGQSTSDPDALRAVRRAVGLLFQDADNQFVTTTAEREIAFGLENLQMPAADIRRQVDQALEEFDLVRYRHTPPHEMSGGEKARLALATVWVMGARLLVLDETDSLLDRRASERLRKGLHDLPPDTGVLQVTTEAERAVEADRVLVLHQGRLVADGPPDAVWESLPDEVVTCIGVPLVWRLSRGVTPQGPSTGSWQRLLASIGGTAVDGPPHAEHQREGEST